MFRILFVEDNITQSRLLIELLPRPPYLVQVARSVFQAQEYLRLHKYDLVILDRMLPDGDGLEVVETLYQEAREVPILMLSVKAAAEERVRGLRKGADDYLAKPYTGEELLLRIEKLLFKTKHTATHALHVGYVSLFPNQGLVCCREKQVQLRKKESEILEFLMRHRNSIVTRESLIENIWYNDEMPTYKTIDVYVRRLRMLLGDGGEMIKTVRGYGYMARADSV